MPADEQVITLAAQEPADGSDATPKAKGKVTAVDEPEISFSIWAAVAAVLGFGFGGLLALRARAKAKAEKTK